MKSKKSYKYKYERKKRSKSKRSKKMKKVNSKQKRRILIWGGFNDEISLTKFITYLSKQTDKCTIVNTLNLYLDNKNSTTINIDKCVENVLFVCNKQLNTIIIPLIIWFNDIDGHANLLIIRNNIVEWFEPHGDAYKNNLNNDVTNIEINNLTKTFLELFIDKLNTNNFNCNKTFVLKTPEMLCPLFKETSVQQNDNLCMIWMLYVLVQIVKNPTNDTTKIINNMLKIGYDERVYIIKKLKKEYTDFLSGSVLNDKSIEEIIDDDFNEKNKLFTEQQKLLNKPQTYQMNSRPPIINSRPQIINSRPPITIENYQKFLNSRKKNTKL